MLENKVAIVTGASRGIGRAIAKELASQGATVVINYVSSSKAADEVVSEIVADGGNAEAIQADVSSFEACENLVNEVHKKYGSVDILINNAGITKDGLVMGLSEQDFDSVIDTNLKGAFNTIHAVYKIMMRQRSGKIINMSSVSGVSGNAGQSNYSAAKAGIIGLTKSVAKELASRGVCCNAIAPGFIETDMTDALSDKVKENIGSQIPMKRFGKPEDVARVCAFLASSASDYVTGQVINVDGGLL